MPLPLVAVFADLPDPRREHGRRHHLTDLLVLAVCAVLSGADTWEQMAEYGRRKKAFFERFLALPNGIPSHDTFYAVFTKLDPVAFSGAFGRWMASACQGSGLIPVAVDGKSSRRSKKATATGCLHLVSAWATANRLTLGQVSVSDGSNEVAAIPELLAVLELAGAIVTIDAAGCQIENAAVIRNAGGHYLLAVKDNQPTLRAVAEGLFADALAVEFAGVDHDTHVTTEVGHGRGEERCVTALYHPVGLPDDWRDVDCVVRVIRERVADGVRTSATHYYLTSHPGTAEELGGFIRGHWGVENGLHWVLDVAFREDESRTRAGHAGANLGMVRRVAVSLLRTAPGKGSVATRRLQAAWDDEYLLAVLQGFALNCDA
jgi:predicted transposase YbfD/YdcC